MGHSERKHALLSASGAHRWLACTPSAKLEDQFPDTESEAAAEGTLAHELAEMKVRNYFFPKELGKRKLNSAVKKLSESGLWKDEMQGYTDDYLDYIKTTALSLKSMPSVRIEQRVYFKEYTLADPEDEIEGSGIADCILLYGDKRLPAEFQQNRIRSLCCMLWGRIRHTACCIRSAKQSLRSYSRDLTPYLSGDVR